VLKNQNILIFGASVVGPALAYWLRRYGQPDCGRARPRVTLRRHDHVDLRGHTGCQGHIREGRTPHVRPGDRRRRAALRGALAGIRRRVGVHHEPWAVHLRLHHAQRAGPRLQGPVLQLTGQDRGHVPGTRQHRSQGDVLLHVRAAGLRPAGHRAPAATATRRVRRRWTVRLSWCHAPAG
jgi:hypothetical protein